MTRVSKCMGPDKLRVKDSLKTRNKCLQWLWDYYIVGRKEPYVINYRGGRVVVIHKSIGDSMEILECLVERAGILPKPGSKP